MKPTLNKWQYFFTHAMDYRYGDFAWRNVEMGIIKLIEFPTEGERVQKKHYKGIWIRFSYWFPIRFID